MSTGKEILILLDVGIFIHIIHTAARCGWWWSAEVRLRIQRQVHNVDNVALPSNRGWNWGEGAHLSSVCTDIGAVRLHKCKWGTVCVIKRCSPVRQACSPVQLIVLRNSYKSIATIAFNLHCTWDWTVKLMLFNEIFCEGGKSAGQWKSGMMSGWSSGRSAAAVRLV